MKTPAKPYHHGNLKQALIGALLDLLQHTSFEKISLRKVASEVGVAPAAVYNHFKSKEDLHIAAKLKCMMHLADYLDDCVVGVESPEQKICELGKAYYRYSRQYSPYFEFMISTHIPDHCITDDIIEVSMRSESALRIAVIELYEKHHIPTCAFSEGLGTFGCWAIAHGISDLANKSLNLAACHSGRWSNEFLLQDTQQIDACFEAMTSVIVHGLLATAKAKAANTSE